MFMFTLTLVVCASIGADSVNEWLATQKANEQESSIKAFWAARNNQLNAVRNQRIQLNPAFLDNGTGTAWAVPNHMLSDTPFVPSWSPYAPSIPTFPFILPVFP